MADHGSYFITTLNRTKENIYIYIYIQCYSHKTIASLCNTFSERESIWVILQKGYKLEVCFSSQILALVKSFAVIKNVMFCFSWI